MYKNLTLTAILGIVAVVLGAFGAHALKTKLSIEAMESFQTAIRYQFIHVLLLLFVNTFHEFTSKQKNTISSFLFLGITFFSGSIYAIYLGNIPAKAIWFVTPLGGFLLVLGWGFLAYLFLLKAKSNNNG